MAKTKREMMISNFYKARDEKFNFKGVSTPLSWPGKGRDSRRDDEIANFVYRDSSDRFAYTCYAAGSDDNIMICLKGVNLTDREMNAHKFKVPDFFDMIDGRLFGRLLPIRKLDINQVQYVMLDYFVPDEWKGREVDCELLLTRYYNDSIIFYSRNPAEIIGANQLQVLRATNLKSLYTYYFDCKENNIKRCGEKYEINWHLGYMAYTAKVEMTKEQVHSLDVEGLMSFAKVVCVDEKVEATYEDDLKAFRKELIDYYKTHFTQEFIDRNAAMDITATDGDGLIIDMELEELGSTKISYKYDARHDWLILCNVYTESNRIIVHDVFDICKLFFDDNLEYLDLGRVQYLMKSGKRNGLQNFEVATLIGEKLKLTSLIDENGNLCCDGKTGLSFLEEYKKYDLIESKCLLSYCLASLKFHLSVSADVYDYLGCFNYLSLGDVGHSVAHKLEKICFNTFKLAGGSAANMVLTTDLFGNW